MRITGTTALFGLLLAFVSGTALAVDGVIEINQARALAGGVTDGDEPGFPVTISESGSYILTGNLDLDANGINAVDITAPDVTFDLNGFAITGAGEALDGSKGIAIGMDGATVKNGTIKMMDTGVDALNAAETAAAENVFINLKLKGNIRGINLGPNNRLLDSSITDNQSVGILVNRSGVLVKNCTVARNEKGITVQSTKFTLRDSVVRDHQLGAIDLLGANHRITNNTITNNREGIDAGFAQGVQIIGNTLSDNASSGVPVIDAGSGARVVGNIVQNNDEHGIRLSNGGLVIGNVIENNNGTGLIGASGTSGKVTGFKDNYISGNDNEIVGELLTLGENICGNVLCGSGE